MLAIVRIVAFVLGSSSIDSLDVTSESTCSLVQTLAKKDQLTKMEIESVIGIPDNVDPDEVQCVFTTHCDVGIGGLDLGELLIFSALRVGQRGPLTHVIHGCTFEQEAVVRERKQRLFHNFPDITAYFANISAPSDGSRAMPKPLSLASWSVNIGPARNTVAVLDADMIFLQPLRRQLPAEYGPAQHDFQFFPAAVSKGFTLSASYHGFYAETESQEPWVLAPNDITIHPSQVCGESSKCANLTKKDLSNFAVGVPYIADAVDLPGILASWAEFTMRLYELGDTTFYIDMHSWTLAVAHNDVKSLRHDALMVSLASGDGPENWSFVNSRASPAATCTTPPSWQGSQASESYSLTPVFLHYCQHYSVGNLEMFKPSTKFECGGSGVVLPGDVLGDSSSKKEWQNYFAYCALGAGVNALRAWSCETMNASSEEAPAVA